MEQSPIFTYHPQNPYVIDENYFLNTSHVTYKDTLFYYIFHGSFMSSTFLGLLSVAFVMYLVIFKTPRHFKPYSRMLIICAISDTYVILADFFCMARIKIQNNMIIVSISGIASKLGFNGQCFALSWQATAVLIASACLPTQYYIRYSTIKNNYAPSPSRITFCFLINVLFVLPCFYTTTKAFCSYENLEHKDFASNWYSEVPIPILMVAPQTHLPLLIHLGYMSLISTSSYAISILISRLTINELKRRNASLSLKTQNLQNQFAKTLFFQSLCPLCTAVIPLILAITAMFINKSIDNFGDFMIMTVSWFPFLNSISTVLLIVPYRRYCLSLLCCSKKTRFSNSSASVVPAVSTIQRSNLTVISPRTPAMPLTNVIANGFVA